MKKTFAAFALAALVAFSGCDKGTPGGAPTKDKKPGVLKTEDNTFTLSVPTLSTKIKQGETKEVTIGIKRGKNFGEDVALTFDGLPKGVTIEPVTLKKGDKDVAISIKATDEAALGDATVKVSGKPEKGETATHDLKVTVEKKK